jgi:hypothetical protein
VRVSENLLGFWTAPLSCRLPLPFSSRFSQSSGAVGSLDPNQTNNESNGGETKIDQQDGSSAGEKPPTFGAPPNGR